MTTKERMQNNFQTSKMYGSVDTGLPVDMGTPQLVEVTAPATLAEGYSFTATLNGRMFNVQVPAGGVKEGQTFNTTYPQRFLDENEGNQSDGAISNTPGGVYEPPTGMWKDGICDCCSNGCCIPQVWCALCCAIPFQGQIMTRLNLTWLGSPGVVEKTKNTFKIVVVCYVVFEICIFILSQIESQIVTKYLQENPDVLGSLGDDYTPFDAALQLQELTRSGALGPVYSVVSSIGWLLSTILSVWLLVTMIRTRMYVRRKYDIKAKCCGDCVEDCCVSFWCTCCTLGQMARHTSDIATQGSACCTSTGLQTV